MDSSDDASPSESEPDDEITDFSVQVKFTMQQLHHHDIGLGEVIARVHEHVTNTHDNKNSIKLLLKSQNRLAP